MSRHAAERPDRGRQTRQARQPRPAAEPADWTEVVDRAGGYPGQPDHPDYPHHHDGHHDHEPAADGVTDQLPAWVPDRRRRPNAPERLVGLDGVRALAIVLVCYTQLATWFGASEHGDLPGHGVIDTYLVDPLRLNADLRFLGLSLFYLISGFVIANVAVREPAAEYAVKRVLRIFPGLAAAALLAWALLNAGYDVLGDTELTEQVELPDLFASMVLLNFFTEPYLPLVPVAWSLVPVAAVYLMVGLFAPLLRREPWVAIALQLTLCSVALAASQEFAELDTALVPASPVGTIGTFCPVLLAGQVIWLVWAGRAPAWAGGLLGAACWVVFCWGDRLGYTGADAGYPLTVAYTAVIVVIGVQASGKVPRTRIVHYLASRSYAIFLVHQTVAVAVLTELAGQAAAALTLAAAVFAVLAAGELLYWLAGRPSAALASWLTDRLDRAPPAIGRVR